MENTANTLPKYGNHNLRLKTIRILPFGPFYNLSQNKFEVLQEYIAAKGFIQIFHSFARAFVLFVKKRDRNLYLFIDYRGFNLITKKNRYLLPLILKVLYQVVKGKIFTKLNIRAAYNQIRVEKRDG